MSHPVWHLMNPRILLAQHSCLFLLGVTDDFEVIEEFLDMAGMSSTTTGQDISSEVIKLIEKFELDPQKLHGLTTDGARNMTGIHIGF